jgi:pimeloyl-ACP methyl ester carboxylesterase
VRCPERVSGLVLYGGYAQGRALRDLAPDDIKEDTVLGLIRAGWGKADSAFMNAFSTLFMPDATPAQMDDFVKMQLVTIAPENAAELRQIVDRFDVRAHLPLLRAPTLVVHALGDAIQPIEQGRILASEIPDARFLPLDSRNHIPLPQQGSWAHMMQETGQFLENMCRAR